MRSKLFYNPYVSSDAPAVLCLLLVSTLLGSCSFFKSKQDSNPTSSSITDSSPSPKDSNCPTLTQESILFEVLYCHDGDTCRVQVVSSSVSFNVRLYGIDAPELSKKHNVLSDQPFSKQSAQKLNELVRGKRVKLEQFNLDMYNRPIVRLTLLDNTDINLKMLNLGLAEVYRGSKSSVPDSKYLEAELNAKKQKLGIWSSPDYMSPYEYRKLNTKAKSKARSRSRSKSNKSSSKFNSGF